MMIPQRCHNLPKLFVRNSAGEVRCHHILLAFDNEEGVKSARLRLPAAVGDQRHNEARRQAVEQIGLAVQNKPGLIS